MGNRTTLLILLFVLCHGLTLTMGLRKKEGPSPSPKSDKMFMLRNSKRLVKTDAGEMRVLESYGGGKILERRLHIGFITMEPMSLFVPQYIDSSFIVFVRGGEANVGIMCKGKLRERRLKKGDVYRIPAGSAFYMVNSQESETLHIICSIDPSESMRVGTFQSFYIGGGANPASVLSGFQPEILETAFNVSGAELKKIFTRQHEGPIVHLSDSHHRTSLWTKFLQLKEEDKLQHLKKMVQDQEDSDDDDDDDKEEEEEEEEEEKQKSWSWRKLLDSVLCNENKNKKKEAKHNKGSHHSHFHHGHSCNLYDRKPDFENSYGWSVAVDGSDYSPLRRSGVGVYHVNLSPGAMMTPHLNPRATEYGIVLRGSGRIQIVFPNGSNAMDARVKQGDVFFVPRYFPICQMASGSEPLEFFGFTTSAKKSRPQFLVGATSLMRTMMGPELAAAFGVSEDTMKRVVHAQREAVILPMHGGEHNMKEKEVETIPKLIRNSVIMGF